MLHSALSQSESPADALLRVAEYLRRPPHFLAVAEARAAFRHTLELVHQASVVLTTNGEPAAWEELLTCVLAASSTNP